MTSRRLFLQTGFLTACALTGAGLALAQPRHEGSPQPFPPGTKWYCPPCGCAADGKDFDAPGLCPACSETLLPKMPEAKPPA